MYQNSRSGWGWDEYAAYSKVGVACFEDDYEDRDEYDDYEQDNQPSWHKFVQYEDSK
jgi:hypothetical protein